MTVSVNLSSDCFKDIVCGLSERVKGKIVTICQSYIALLELELVQLESKLLVLNTLIVPVRVAAQAVGTVRSAAQDVSALIPLAPLRKCVQVQDVAFNVEETVDAALGWTQRSLEDLERLVAFADELSAEIDEMKAAIAVWQTVIDDIRVCPERVSVQLTG